MVYPQLEDKRHRNQCLFRKDRVKVGREIVRGLYGIGDTERKSRLGIDMGYAIEIALGHSPFESQSHITCIYPMTLPVADLKARVLLKG